MKHKIFPYIVILFGCLGVFLSIRGVFIGEIPFIGRDDSYYSIVKLGNEKVFWFVETLYFVGGMVCVFFGKRETKRNEIISK